MEKRKKMSVDVQVDTNLFNYVDALRETTLELLNELENIKDTTGSSKTVEWIIQQNQYMLHELENLAKHPAVVVEKEKATVELPGVEMSFGDHLFVGRAMHASHAHTHTARRVQKTRNSGRGRLSSEKAKEILRDGTAHGHPLTKRQKRFFGWVAGGRKPRAR
jgi:hypothetical protein